MRRARQRTELAFKTVVFVEFILSDGLLGLNSFGETLPAAGRGGVLRPLLALRSFLLVWRPKNFFLVCLVCGPAWVGVCLCLHGRYVARPLDGGRGRPLPPFSVTWVGPEKSKGEKGRAREAALSFL